MEHLSFAFSICFGFAREDAKKGRFLACLTRNEFLGLSIACRWSPTGRRAEVCRTDARNHVFRWTFSVSRSAVTNPSMSRVSGWNRLFQMRQIPPAPTAFRHFDVDLAISGLRFLLIDPNAARVMICIKHATLTESRGPRSTTVAGDWIGKACLSNSSGSLATAGLTSDRGAM